MSSVLTLWIPCEASKPLYEKITKMYHKQNSDVFFDIKEFPLTQYWKILLESIKNEEGPDLFFMHNEHYDQLKKAGCIAPYQFNEEQFKRLSDVYPMESNKGYYYDFALLTSLLYLQPDIEINPTTAWNACFQQIAKEDKYEYDFGCSINLDAVSAFYYMAALQHNEFKSEEKNTTEQWIKTLFSKYHIFDPHIDCKEAFIKNEIEMVYSWGWFAGYLKDKNKDFRVLPLCYEGNSPYADRRNTKSSFGINAHSKNKAEALDFIFYFLYDEEIQKLFCLTRKVVPLHKNIRNDKDIFSDEIILSQASHVSNTLMPEKPLDNIKIENALMRMYAIYETNKR